ncbi:MAG: discoidin domain-containing protein [Clostridia bacterium]|nr:discoidin domain-containing protein [Clostridia bacterium]
MKKLLLIVMLLVLAIAMVACATPETTTQDGTDSTTAPTTTVGGGETTTTQEKTETTEPEGKLEKTENYTAVLNEEQWVSKGDIDTTKFQYFGSATDVTAKIGMEYKNRTWFLLDENGNKTEMKYAEVRKLGTIGARVESKADGTNEITVTEVNTIVQASWKSVTAKAGSYLMFDFTTNLPMNFYMTVTKDEGGKAASAVYKQDGVTVTKAGSGKYTGVAKCTVPYAKGQTFYINICVDDGATVLASIPVEITAAKYDSQYSLMFQGDWELIKDPDYLANLVDLFYNVYPRLYARFAFGSEPKQITFMADKNYDGVAYCAGTTVCVSVAYANSNPRDLGFFSHEITHSVQQYGRLTNYGGKNNWTDPSTGKVITCNSWWTENMANFGGFRYFHWGYSTKFVQIYNVQTQSYLWNWNWEPYGDGSKLFLSYVDQTFPTTDKNNDGKVTTDEYGVIDLINYTIKTASQSFSDHPYDPESPFNKAVYTATGGKFKTMEEVRQQYEKDCRSGAWVFKGFGNCVDNFRTENLPGIPNPTYPMLEKVTPGDKTNTPNIQNDVETPTLPSGTNLALNATVVEYSSQISDREGIAKAFDGKLDTMWRGGAAVSDYKYELQGFDHGFIIDLGESKAFDTYVLVNAGLSKNDSFNMVSWEILVSEDGKNWTSVDYQASCANDVVTVNVGDQTARYIEMRVFKADKGSSGSIRLMEFMLFKAD